MTIHVNGEPREVAAGTTISTLLAELEVPPDGVAVAVDGLVVPRSRHAETPLGPEARVEIVRAVGGG